jgi:hypothetical protein
MLLVLGFYIHSVSYYLMLHEIFPCYKWLAILRLPLAVCGLTGWQRHRIAGFPSIFGCGSLQFCRCDHSSNRSARVCCVFCLPAGRGCRTGSCVRLGYR